MDIYLQTGQRLRALRLEAGLTQEDLAEKADISVSFLSFLETARRKGSLETYYRLANALQINLADLFRDIGTAKKRSQPAHPLLANLNAAESRAVVSLIKALRKKK